MFRTILLSFLILVNFTACLDNNNKKMKISVSNWIGYTPILYAKEKNWLESLNIKVVNVVSLNENYHLFKSGNSEAFTGTQYEFKLAKQTFPTLFPLILFDKSNGGDVVMGNYSLDEYQNVEEIDAYLEIDSINLIILEDFIKKHKLQDKKINYINKDQSYISTLRTSNIDKPTLIITYIPYNNNLTKNGFQQLASTADSLDLLVIDALFITKENFVERKEELIALKKFIDLAIVNLKNNPKEYFETISKYFPNMSYEEFTATLYDIQWINDNLAPELIDRLKQDNIPIRDLLK